MANGPWLGISTIQRGMLSFLIKFLLCEAGPSNSRGKLFSVSVIAHGSRDQSCDS